MQFFGYYQGIVWRG